LPPRLDPVAMRLAGWEGLAAQVEAARVAVGADFVVADSYAVTSELAWLLPPNVRVVGMDARWRLLDLPGAPIAGASGILVEGADRGVDQALWTQIQPVGAASRAGSGASGFVLYRVVAQPKTEAVAMARQ
jgi:hypothetical protein